MQLHRMKNTSKRFDEQDDSKHQMVPNHRSSKHNVLFNKVFGPSIKNTNSQQLERK